MARVVALTGDLLFGSQVQGALRAAGHDVRLLSDAGAVRPPAGIDVLVVDLTSGTEGADLLEAMRAADELGTVRTLAFYAHVDVDVRERAQKAGFDLVVPRSRMAREGAELVTRLAAAADSS
jgi:hypothetical protein